MHYLTPTANGRNVLGMRAQLVMCRASAATWLRPTTASTPAARATCAASIFAAQRPTATCPTASRAADQSGRQSCVPRDPTNPQLNQCIQVPLPVYGIASIGGDTSLTTNIEYRIPIAGPVMFSFFDDFGIDVRAEPRPVEAEPGRLCLADRPALRLPGVQQRLLPGRHSRLAGRLPAEHPPHSGTNFVPRMSLGGELSVIMPIINAPFRLYYAYNPLRLYESPYCNSVINWAATRAAARRS
jgi:outer membrane protein insertion porin family